jgi:hypothetical protein
METVCSSETLVSTYESTWRHNPEEQHQHLHRRENLKISHSHYSLSSDLPSLHPSYAQIFSSPCSQTPNTPICVLHLGSETKRHTVSCERARNVLLFYTLIFTFTASRLENKVICSSCKSGAYGWRPSICDRAHVYFSKLSIAKHLKIIINAYKGRWNHRT